MSGVVAAVEPSSLAARLGLRPGDELLAVNGHPVRDVIDVRFYAAEEHLRLDIRRAGREVHLEADRRYGEPLGLEFAAPVFDGIRRCHNHCSFCFVAQMGPGLRPSLYIRDDDYRYSFLYGNYITLTNLTPADWERIAAQHLSPLYVSVHATDPALRRRVLGNPAAPPILPQLRRLAALGVSVHTQVVLTPGLNDGPALDRTISDLADLYPAVRSVSIVPVGLTKYHRGGCRVHTPDEARAVFARVTARQPRLRERLGVTFAYLSDEWYLRLGEEVPPAAAYDGLDLTENGVGMVRRFLDRGVSLPTGAHLLATGTLFAPTLRRAVAGRPDLEVVPVVNRFFGETVTVAGLLTGADVVETLRGRVEGRGVVLPKEMFGGPEGRTLDGMTAREIGAALGVAVVKS